MPGNPYAGYTGQVEVVANYIYNMLSAQVGSLNLDPTTGVFYSDQTLLPTTPAICVVPGNRASVPNGAGGRPMLNTFTTFVMVYFGKIQDVQQNVHASLTLAGNVEKIIHADPTFNGLVIDAYCSGVEPGVASKMGALLDATRVTVTARSKVVLNP